MTRAEAKRRVCKAVAGILDNDGENAWLSQDDKGRPLSGVDEARMYEAFHDLVAQLRRRGEGQHKASGQPTVEYADVIVQHDRLPGNTSY